MKYAWFVDSLTRGRFGTRQQIADKLGITVGEVNTIRTWLNTYVRPDAGLAGLLD